MRMFVLALALANLLFLAWATWIDVPRAGSTMARDLPLLQVLAASAAGPEALAPPPSLRCASFGPLPDEASANAVQAALTARKLTPRGREAPVEELAGYAVFIDRLADTAARRAALARLARAGVLDAAALPDQQRISAGLFATQEAADQRAAAVRKSGLVPVVEASNRVVNRRWLDVDAPAEAQLPTVESLTAGLTLAVAPAWGSCPPAP